MALAFAQRVRKSLYLRSLVFSLGSPEANGIVFTAALETTSILRIVCLQDIVCATSLRVMLRAHCGLHPREITIPIDNEILLLRDLFVQCPGRFVVPNSCGNRDFLRSVDAQLRNPAYSLRSMSTGLHNSGVTEEALVSLFLAVASCASLSEVRLWGIPDLWIHPFIVVLDTATNLKSLTCMVSGLEKDPNPIVGELADAMVRNEVLERVSIHTGFKQLCPLLTSAVRTRNVAMCVRRCRLLFLSWVLDDECHDDMLFDAAVVYDVLVFADLDWSEQQRSELEARGLTMVATEMAKFNHDGRSCKFL